LNAGIPATVVAEWAGQSVEILLRIYVKCLDGGLAQFRRLIDGALGPAATPKLGNVLGTGGRREPQTAG
jgi:hypothetical protein